MKSAAELHNSGIGHLQSNNIQGALDDFAAAHDREPRNAQYLTSLGFAYRITGQKDLAESCFHEALLIDPAVLIARYQLGNLKLERNLAAPRAPDFQKVSVVIPSRLDRHPRTNMLWLDRSVKSVLQQTAAKNIEIEIIVGTDPGAEIPEQFKNNPNIRFVEAIPQKHKGQAAAINSAMAAATGDLVAMIEDDDVWHPKRLEYGLLLLPYYDFVSANQMEVDPDDTPLGLNDFPTPCGWIMRRSVWDEVGPMNEDFPCHLDTEWLGRLNKAEKLRCHIVDSTVPMPFDAIVQERPLLLTLIRWMPAGSGIFRSRENVPLIMRTAHPGSGMARIRTDPIMAQKSADEHARMKDMFGYFPW